MIHRLIYFCSLLATVTIVRAHFVFVVPQPGNATAKVILSEDLKPSPEVDAGIISAGKLSLRDASGGETPLSLTREDAIYVTALPGTGTRVIYGSVDLGVMQRGGGKTYDLVYYPKTIVGDSFDPKTRIGAPVPVEIVPTGENGALRLKLLVRGQPRADTEITVILPDGTQQKMKTGASGETPALTQTGRYGAWARSWETTPGEQGGKKYEEVRNYATLVMDLNSEKIPGAGTPKISAKPFGNLPQAASSFGAVASDGWLYVYGGHIVPTHSYSTSSVSGKFARSKLSPGSVWEQLPSGPALQGMNLAASHGVIYRAGGMEPRNQPGKPADIHSVAECARFEPKSATWESITPLPEPRSSHDVAVIGDRLFVVGGWTLKGSAKTEWPETMDVLDLSAATPEWKKLPQPFKRRALIAAAFEGKLYVIGGFDENSKVQRSVDVFDPQTETWSKGPDLPGDEMNGFAPAACAFDKGLFVSVGDGGLYRLSVSRKAWEKVGTGSPRLAHRIVPDGDSVLIIGGAAKDGNLDSIEAIALD